MSETKSPLEGVVPLENLLNDDPFFTPSNNGSEELELNDPDDEDKDNDDPFFVDDSINNDREKQQQKDDIKIQNPFQQVFLEQLTDFGIETVLQQDKDGNDVEVPVKDLDLTPELYKEIVKTFFDEQKQELTKDKIPASEMSELLKNMHKIEKAGGSVSAILQKKAEEVEPISELDLSTEQGQAKAVEIFLKANGKDQEDIEARIQLYREKGVLAEKAEEFQSQIQSAFDKYVENQVAAAEQAKKEREENLKTYKKDFSEGLKEFELNDAAKKKLVDFTTKFDKDGSELWKALRQKISDPKQAAKIALFIMDEEEFIKQVTNKTVVQEKLKTAVKIGTVNLKRKVTDGDDFLGTSSDRSGRLIPIE